jgi:hypothetical protein
VRPQDPQYYQCAEDYFETLEQVYDERFAKKYGFFRPYARQVIYRYPETLLVNSQFTSFCSISLFPFQDLYNNCFRFNIKIFANCFGDVFDKTSLLFDRSSLICTNTY